jgi:hypothetical protein
MTQPATAKAPKERSKSFPVIPLKAAVERLQQFEKKFGRHPAPWEKTGLAWGMEEGSSQASRVLAALKAFGFVEYFGMGKERTASISETGRTYLRAQQESIRKEILKSAALKPKQIAHYWPGWGVDRPPNEICLDQLILKDGFTEASAPQFLKVYDETIAYAGLLGSDKLGLVDVSEEDDDDDGGGAPLNKPDETDWSKFAEGLGRAAPGMRHPQDDMGPQSASGMRRAVFNVAEGDVTISFPDGMSKDSVTDLEGYLKVWLRKIRRDSGHPEEPEKPN